MHGDFSLESGHDVTVELMKREPRPTAIFASDELTGRDPAFWTEYRDRIRAVTEEVLVPAGAFDICVAKGVLHHLDDDAATEVFREAGFATAAFTEGGWVSRQFGLDLGFDVWEEPEERVSVDDLIKATAVYSLIPEYLVRNAR